MVVTQMSNCVYKVSLMCPALLGLRMKMVHSSLLVLIILDSVTREQYQRFTI